MTTRTDPMTTDLTGPTRSRRLDPLALSGVALTVVAFTATAPADPADTSAAGRREHLSTAAGAWQVYAVLMAVSAAILVVFTAHLRTVLVAAVRATGPGAALPDLAFGAGLLAAGWLMMSAGFTGVAAADIADRSDVALEALWSLGAAGDMVGVAAFAAKGLLMVTVGITVLRTSVLGAWLGWLSVLLGVLTWLAIGVAPLFYAGIFAFALWPLVVSVSLLVSGWRRGVVHTDV